ncbi:tyrosine-type recombinase/integrase, partial [Chloroflexota bacterium]
KTRLFRFFSWLTENYPEIIQIEQIRRCHIEAFKEYIRWVHPQHKSNRVPGDVLCSSSRYHILAALYYFFNRIAEWQWPEVPKHMLVFTGDFPILDRPSPKFLDEISAARFLEAARNHPDLFTRLCGVTLILTGMRQGEFLNLTADCVVQIGENYWLRVPLGKMHNDRYIPLHPEVKQLLDEWVAQSLPKEPYDFLFTSHGYRLGRGKVALAVERIGKAAGIKEHIAPHRLRHTLATLAVNRGMPLESIAALLGHRSLSMTMVYARIGNRTVQQEYSQVSKHLEELSRAVVLNPGELTLVEGDQMKRLRQDHWRMLGNGYCTRPDGVPCEYETICESCPCFSTTVEFLPILNKQKRDAENKGQAQRVEVFTKLIRSVGKSASEANDIPS